MSPVINVEIDSESNEVIQNILKTIDKLSTFRPTVLEVIESSDNR